MGCDLLSYEVRNLTLGKPPLPWLPSTATVGQAIRALALHSEISIWLCSPSSHHRQSILPLTQEQARDRACANCCCIGKISMLHVLSHLSSLASSNSSKGNIQSNSNSNSNRSSSGDDEDILECPVSVLLPPDNNLQPSPVHHIHPRTSLMDALELVASGVQNLIVPIDHHYHAHSDALQSNRGLTGHNMQDYCWLTQEDILRFLLGFIGTFSLLPMMTITDLGLVNPDLLTIDLDEDAASGLNLIEKAAHEGAVVAVVVRSDEGGAFKRLVGEISQSSMKQCDEATTLTLATLPTRDLLVFAKDCENPPEYLAKLLRARLCERNASMPSTKEELNEQSSEDESNNNAGAPHLQLSRRWSSFNTSSLDVPWPRLRTRSSPLSSWPLTCRPRSSLVGVMVQALAHRESHVWVTNDERSNLLGIVTFQDIVALLHGHLTTFTSSPSH